MNTEKYPAGPLPGILVFEISKKRFCMDFDDIYAILSFPEYRQITGFTRPVNTDFIFNKKRVQIVQLEYGNLCNKITNSSRIIIVDLNESLLGFWADSILEIRIFEEDESSRFKGRNKILSRTQGISVMTETIDLGGKAFLIPAFSTISNYLK
ncbi:MAG: chemotaxis protein CheW [Bacillota bacterium]